MIFIIHDNLEWLSCLIEQLKINKLDYYDWDLGNESSILTKINFEEPPPYGVYYNRVSPSSHYRNARYSLENCKIILNWLEKYGRTVINGSKSLELELSKMKQYLELSKVGLNYPETYIAVTKKEILEKSSIYFNNKCIIKHNRSGSGKGVKLINNKDELIDYLLSNNYSEPIDGITLVQKYIKSDNNYIIRIELIDYKFIYAIKVDTNKGFNLCPADNCDIKNHPPLFKIMDNFKEDLLIKKILRLLKNNKIRVCGIEFIKDAQGVNWIYDINCNTNYNKKAEIDANIPLKATNKLIKLLSYKMV